MIYRKMPKRRNSNLTKKIDRLAKKVSMIDTTIERKKIDIQTRGTLSGVIPLVAFCHNCIDLANIGPDVNERIGNKITVRQVQIRSTLVQNTAADSISMIRMVVVQWLNNQSTPVPADINNVLDFTPATNLPTSMEAMNAPYLINSLKKYRVLDDRVIRLSKGGGGLSQVKLYKKYFTLKGKNQQCTFENVTPVREDPSNNQVTLFLLPGYPVGTVTPSVSAPQFFTESRCYYQDA